MAEWIRRWMMRAALSKIALVLVAVTGIAALWPGEWWAWAILAAGILYAVVFWSLVSFWGAVIRSFATRPPPPSAGEGQPRASEAGRGAVREFAPPRSAP
jgi:hypothetical protein